MDIEAIIAAFTGISAKTVRGRIRIHEDLHIGVDMGSGNDTTVISTIIPIPYTPRRIPSIFFLPFSYGSEELMRYFDSFVVG